MSAARIEELERKLLEARSSCVAAARTAEQAMERLLIAEEMADAARALPVRYPPDAHTKRLAAAVAAWDKMRPS